MKTEQIDDYFKLYKLIDDKFKKPDKIKVKKNIVVLSGAGMSAESGIETFRGANGMWRKYNIEEVASPQAWAKNPQLVLDFYNERRKKLIESHPNRGHEIIAEWEKDFNVQIVTQNVDDLHERAGSTNVLHLHGELRKVRSVSHPELIYELPDWELKLGDKCEKGSQLRPHIVWFGERVEKMDEAQKIVKNARIFIVVGTSLQVMPAAYLVNLPRAGIPVYIVDPVKPTLNRRENMIYFKEKASTGLEKVNEVLMDKISFSNALIQNPF